jgi:hypothetical protein
MTLGSNADGTRTTQKEKAEAVLFGPTSPVCRRARHYQDQPNGGRSSAASLDSVSARRLLRSWSGREKACGAVEQKKCLINKIELASRSAIRERLRVGKVFLHVAGLVGAAMCSAC